MSVVCIHALVTHTTSLHGAFCTELNTLMALSTRHRGAEVMPCAVELEPTLADNDDDEGSGDDTVDDTKGYDDVLRRCTLFDLF